MRTCTQIWKPARHCAAGAFPGKCSLRADQSFGEFGVPMRWGPYKNMSIQLSNKFPNKQLILGSIFVTPMWSPYKKWTSKFRTEKFPLESRWWVHVLWWGRWYSILQNYMLHGSPFFTLSIPPSEQLLLHEQRIGYSELWKQPSCSEKTRRWPPPVTGQSKLECYRIMALSPALRLNMMETRTRDVVVLQYTVGRAWAREGNTTSEWYGMLDYHL